MKAAMRGTEDRLSEFPDEIIHHILSYLPIKVAAQTTILSSRWKHICNSYPVFDFCQNYLFNVDPNRLTSWELDRGISEQERPQYLETLEKFTTIVDQKLEKFSEYKLGIQKFKLSITLVGEEFHSFVDKWMEVASEKHVKELDLFIMAEGKYCYVLPQTIFATKFLTVLKISGYNMFLEDPFMESAVDLHSLRILSLENVYIDEKTTQNLISSCPFVEELYLSFNLETLQSLNVYGLVKLVNLTVIMRNGKWVPMKLFGCEGLQRVSLRYVALDCVFDDANFPQIEFISLSKIIFRKGFKISSHQLKTLMLRDCYEELDIFAPNLIFVHHGYVCSGGHRYLPFLNDHCKLKAEMYILGGLPVYTPWYIGLTEYLQKQTQTKAVEVSFHSRKVEFDREEVEKVNCLWLPRALESLAVEAYAVPTKNYPAMMDGFFWCCRPQVLSSKTHPTDFLEFLFKMLSDIDDKGCCSSSEMKCWRHSLKVSEFVIVEHQGIEEKLPLCWDTFQNAVPYRPKRSVHFHLTWLHHL